MRIVADASTTANHPINESLCIRLPFTLAQEAKDLLSKAHSNSTIEMRQLKRDFEVQKVLQGVVCHSLWFSTISDQMVTQHLPLPKRLRIMQEPNRAEIVLRSISQGGRAFTSFNLLPEAY